MIILVWLQLIIGTLIIFPIFGKGLNFLQKTGGDKKQGSEITTLISSILLIFIYSIISYYYSVSLDLYFLKHGSSKFVTVITFLILNLLLFGPYKYAESERYKAQIGLAGLIGLILFCVWRYNANFCETLFKWIPVYIWT